MKLQPGMTALVTGAVSGLGEASAIALLERGLNVVAVDLNDERGAAMEAKYPGRLRYVKADVADEAQMQQAIAAAEAFGNFRALVHCAGIGGPVRLIEKDGSPGSLEKYINIIRVNQIGTFNTLRLAAVAMAKNEPVDGERGGAGRTEGVSDEVGAVDVKRGQCFVDPGRLVDGPGEGCGLGGQPGVADCVQRVHRAPGE